MMASSERMKHAADDNNQAYYYKGNYEISESTSCELGREAKTEIMQQHMECDMSSKKRTPVTAFEMLPLQEEEKQQTILVENLV